MPDAVVIGAGPNGLVAANLLAAAGWSVEVLEAQPEPGGAVRSDRGVHPDYVSDLFSAFYPLAAASPVLGGLELQEEGLEWSRAPGCWPTRYRTAGAPCSNEERGRQRPGWICSRRVTGPPGSICTAPGPVWAPTSCALSSPRSRPYGPPSGWPPSSGRPEGCVWRGRWFCPCAASARRSSAAKGQGFSSRETRCTRISAPRRQAAEVLAG